MRKIHNKNHKVTANPCAENYTYADSRCTDKLMPGIEANKCLDCPLPRCLLDDIKEHKSAKFEV
jgi:hypothetical protein